jgi:uncharacterized membrane protein YedE/YeeE
MQLATAALFGLLFGLGILISGMGNPSKVLAFFDFAGHWDPSLAFVMGGAVTVTAVGYRLVFRRGAPLYANSFGLPTVTHIPPSLLAGSVVFGLGWGLTGICPGATVPILGIGSPAPILFFIAMLGGILTARRFKAWSAHRVQAARPVPQS